MLNLSGESRVIAAVRNEKDWETALKSKVTTIFDLSPELFTLKERVESAHGAGKQLFIHLDLAMGIGKDRTGIQFVKESGVDGIISTRVNIIKIAREIGLFTVQRVFIVDAHSVETTIDSARASKTDMIEIMPGIVGKIIEIMKERLTIPLIAGGLIETKEEAAFALSCGAAAVSTGKQTLWEEII